MNWSVSIRLKWAIAILFQQISALKKWTSKFATYSNFSKRSQNSGYFKKILLRYHWFITLYVSCTLYFYSCIPYNPLTTKNLVSICHHTLKSPLTISPSPPLPSPSGYHNSILCIYMFVFLWLIHLGFLFISFFIFHMWVKSYGICLSPSDLLHLA